MGEGEGNGEEEGGGADDGDCAMPDVDRMGRRRRGYG